MVASYRLLAVSVVIASWVFTISDALPRVKRKVAEGPLSDYVYRDDGMYQWFQYDETVQEGYTSYYLNLTSQQWYDSTLSSRPIWWHYLVVHVPNIMRFPSSAFLFISKSRNHDSPPGFGDEHIREMGAFTQATGIVSAVIKFVPNQPIIMENDGVNREEDDFIAWTWRRFYDERIANIDNPEILARMPMCKATVKAMDAVQELLLNERFVNVEEFMIAGQSKRGWTAWLTAAIDARVIAVAPVVLTSLNMHPNFHHYYKSMGGFPFAMYDYYVFGILGLIDTPELDDLAAIVDPYRYKEFLTMPKLIVSGASDEFFLLDDYDYFFHDLPGQNYIWILENSGHEVSQSELGQEYWKMLQTFYLSVLQNYQLPFMDWTRVETETGGSIVMLSPTEPLSISAWSAPSVHQNRRDWRRMVLDENNIPIVTGIQWTESPVEYLGNGYYRASFENPSSGFLAYFIKVVYEGPEGRSLIFTTEAQILPNIFPHEDCVGLQCGGPLV